MRGIWQQIPPVLLVLLLPAMSVLLSVALLYIRLTSGLLGFDREDEAAFVFIGSQKSLVSGIPIANALIPGPAIGPILVPMMLYHAMQLLICAWIARRYAAGAQRLTSGVFPGAVANLVEPVSVIDHHEHRERRHRSREHHRAGRQAIRLANSLRVSWCIALRAFNPVEFITPPR